VLQNFEIKKIKKNFFLSVKNLNLNKKIKRLKLKKEKKM
jgi:hypothetical protein